MRIMSTLNFYEQLTSFRRFEDFVDDRHFSLLPEDWSVVITDVKGSTKAIGEGRYKEVNTIGAAAIVAVKRALGGRDFPYVFGGDGATILVPNHHVASVTQGLLGLKALARSNYGLELRVGIVSHGTLLQQGKTIAVSKFEVTQGKSIAILKGEGVSAAEALVKAEGSRYEAADSVAVEPDLTGLSCRWNPIPSRKGKILTLLVQSRSGQAGYEKFLAKLSEILPAGIEASNPVNVDLASYKSAKDLLVSETKLHRNLFSLAFIKRAIEIIAAVLIFKNGLPPVFFNAKAYAQSMRTHSDFRKFDELLRMTIDCDLEQTNKIKILLEDMHARGEIFFGILESESSLMTCFVEEGLGQGEHIHFIDAEGGGYAAAAVGLKNQMRTQK